MADKADAGGALQAVSSSSALTYASHWNGICKFADLFSFDVFRPGVDDIRRVLVCIQCASTRRDWAAALRFGMLLQGIPWPAERDPLVKAI